MTLVKRSRPPFCQGCTGSPGWGPCGELRPRRHRHGALEAADRCPLWVCGSCRRPSKLVYFGRLEDMYASSGSWPSS